MSRRNDGVFKSSGELFGKKSSDPRTWGGAESNKHTTSETFVCTNGEGHFLRCVECDCSFRTTCSKCGSYVVCDEPCHDDDGQHPCWKNGEAQRCLGGRGGTCLLAKGCKLHEDNPSRICPECIPEKRCSLHENCRVRLANKVEYKDF